MTNNRLRRPALKLSSNVKAIASAGIIAVLVMSLVVYFVLQASYEQQIRNSLFEQYKERQVAYAETVANSIGSDLDSLMARLKAISFSKPIQDGQTAKTDALLKQTYDDASRFAKIDGITIVDKNGIVSGSSNTVNLNQVGLDKSALLSNLGYNSDYPNATYSNAYMSADGKLRIALLYPIYNYDSGQYMGVVALGLDVHSSLSKYGNLDDIHQQYITVIDKNATYLSTPIKANIGANIFSPQNQALITDPRVNEHIRAVMAGQERTALFTIKTYGERLNTGEPIMLNGRQQYSVFVVTPTAAIYGQIDSVIASERTETYLLQGGIAIAIGIALFFLIRWSSTLENIVKDRTQELSKSNRMLRDANAELESANKRLLLHDKMQKEFVNVAAHELKTPVQPIVGIIGLLESDFGGKDETKLTRSDFDILKRNAWRLERLSSDILSVTRIEAGEMYLNIESFDIKDKLRDVVNDVKYTTNGHLVEISYDSPSIVVQADKSKIFEVLSNLVGNAMKFTKDGKIIASATKSDDGREVIIRVKDTGTGIHPEILPRLFGKFVTRSESGTGLGLYISKKIVEAHGGRIWAENNKDGKGATFSFSLPLESAAAEGKDQISSTNDEIA